MIEKFKFLNHFFVLAQIFYSFSKKFDKISVNSKKRVNKMIYGIGLDAVELVRIQTMINKKPKLINRILTKKEEEIFSQLSVKRQVEFLGGRYACKEAFSKAWGTGIGKVSFQEIEILPNSVGAPMVTASPFEKGKVFVSITHTDELALAQIILER